MSEQPTIGQRETKLAQLEANLKASEEKKKSVKGNRTAGAAALLIGILLVLFGGILAALGVFLIIIGGLTLVTAMAKQNNAQVEIDKLNQDIATLRGEIADQQSQPTPVQTATQINAEERLNKLTDLKNKGLIDDTEYQAQRQKILSEV